MDKFVEATGRKGHNWPRADQADVIEQGCDIQDHLTCVMLPAHLSKVDCFFIIQLLQDSLKGVRPACFVLKGLEHGLQGKTEEKGAKRVSLSHSIP